MQPAINHSELQVQ